MREVLKSEVKDTFDTFSKRIDARFKMPNKSENSSGGSLKYLTIMVEKVVDNFKIEINQTFSFLFSQPEELNIQTGLSLTIEKSVRSDFYLHFWHRELIDRIFSRNKISSGNQEFDKKFSAKSSNLIVANSIFRNQNIHDLFLTNKSLGLNINTKNKTVKIKLKNMTLRKYEPQEIETLYLILLDINKLIK